MTHFSTFSELSAYMDRLGLFRMDLTLGRMEAFWAVRGQPDIPVVHVVGTNGKGSTAAFLTSLARAHGQKVGTFTSPHFVTPRERIQVNRRMLSEQAWLELANEAMTVPGAEDLTYFEFQTCLAMLAFERAGVDLAVMEAGLGGRYDATNVFAPGLTLFTPIGMDHEKILGPTLSDIAGDKAGAIREGGVALTGPQEPEAMIRLQERAEAVRARLVYAVDAADPVDHVRLGLRGIHQTTNARLALAGWRWFAAGRSLRTDHDTERFGLESAFLPGRFQSVNLDGREIILDGAHNAHALVALNAAIRAEGVRPGKLVFACLRDKNLTDMLPLIRTLTEGPILVPAMHGERAADNRAIAAAIGGRASASESLQAALDAEPELSGPTLVCGSLYLLAEFYILNPRFLTA
ncbi:bifunctional folylpolyglutamate synthase/dihydrofolate synthase [Pseudodesulfovibrio mercurii]|uniref:bifunctional folylpolyglutamate synthase/dihydrofolate synthase n=1 Tax=Pseudodesulfovibrio mercurii TaxID=641491 RepID=UPI0002DC4264|nr:folylpolyglutamate synthase [Pseudodesulfovibrio mercurii]